MARSTTVRIAGLDEAARRYERLGVAMPEELQSALNEVSTSALKRIGKVFDDEIDEPAAFTAVKTSGRSSVSNRRGRYAAGQPSASSDVHVNPLQSTYLKYHLQDGEDVRKPGDTGVADEWNFIPIVDKREFLAEQGITVRNGQNLGRGVLQRIFKRIAMQRKRLREARERGHEPRFVGALRYAQLFFGRTRAGGTTGIYERPLHRHLKPKLLVIATKRSVYRDTGLVKGWNRSVEEAMDTLPMRMNRRLNEALARIAS